MVSVKVTLLGTAQDAGLPQAGCPCQRCRVALRYHRKVRYPVSIGIRGTDDSFHLVEATRRLPEQLSEWASSLGNHNPIIPDSIIITHLHLGHIEGLGQFGKPVMDTTETPLYSSVLNRKFLLERNDIQQMVKQKNIDLKSIKFNKPFQPTINCGFEIEFISIPHRNELGDTCGIIVRGEKKSLLFMPDHDNWDDTLSHTGSESIFDFFKKLLIDEAWIDGTFWSGDELSNRDMSKIPHPTIKDSLSRLGVRTNEDILVSFIHFNHTNPVCDHDSEQFRFIESKGWGVGTRGTTLNL